MIKFQIFFYILYESSLLSLRRSSLPFESLLLCSRFMSLSVKYVIVRCMSIVSETCHPRIYANLRDCQIELFRKNVKNVFVNFSFAIFGQYYCQIGCLHYRYTHFCINNNFLDVIKHLMKTCVLIKVFLSKNFIFLKLISMQAFL